MGFLTNQINSLPQYEPVAMGPTNDNYASQVDSNTAYANRPASDFQGDINHNVKEQSNLLGPSNPSDPNSEAMNARANQIYNSQINSMTRNTQNAAIARQNQLQGRSIDEQAALYTNLQSRQNLNFQQISYQREAALVQEANKRKIYASLFGAAGSLLGAGAAAGLYSSRISSPIERMPQVPVSQPQQSGGSQMSDYQSLPQYSYGSNTMAAYQGLQ